MQIGEEDLAAAQAAVFLRLRLLDLEDQLGALPELVDVVDQLGAGVAVVLVRAPEPTPAPDCTRTWWPARTSSWTPPCVRATRNSLFFTSVGTATNMRRI